MKTLLLVALTAILVTFPKQIVQQKRTPSNLNISSADIKCLAENIYHEARGESLMGRIAVAQVTVNRLNSQKFGKTICQVVYAPKQFSWTNNPQPITDSRAWRQSLELAEQVLRGFAEIKDFPALWFHHVSIKPRWAKKKKKIAHIGKHVFYTQ